MTTTDTAALTPIEITNQWRGHTLAAAALDGTWTYHRTRDRWAITHTATGRRYWTIDLRAAREQTADGTAATLLNIGQPIPYGKPLTKGEHHAIVDELSEQDCKDMLTAVNAEAPYMVESAVRRVCPDAIPGVGQPARVLLQMLGVVYGGEPDVWLDALRTVRPDLIPPHADRQPAA